MKRLPSILAIGLLCGACGRAIATKAADAKVPDKVVPVYVEVNSHGKITSVTPAVKLSPQLTKLMKRNLSEMIKGPATSNGKPVSSQFAIMLSLKLSQQQQEKYSAQFTPLSIKPVPPGAWYWVHEDGRKWALARQNSSVYEPTFRPQQQPRNAPPPSQPPHGPPPPQHP